MDFVLDVVGDSELLEKEEVVGEIKEDNSLLKVSKGKIQNLLIKVKLSYNVQEVEEEKQLESDRKLKDYKTEEIVDKFFLDMGWHKDPQVHKTDGKKKNNVSKSGLDRFKNICLETGKFKMKAAQSSLAETMKKTVLTPGFEKEHSLPEYNVGRKRQKALRKAERDKTMGPKWFNIPAPEITEELKTDLELLKMRSVMDPKHFYKKNDMEVLPKYFQVGTVIDSPLDHQNERLTRKQRKRTFVDELLDDAQFNKYNKRKYAEIIEEKRKTTYKTYIKDKRRKSKLEYKQKKLEGKVQKKKRNNK